MRRSAPATFGSARRAVGVLPPNGSSTIKTTLTIPAGTPAGTYYIIAVADDGGAVPETNEANKTRAVIIRLSPDLIVSSMTVFPAGFIQGNIDALRAPARLSVEARAVT